MADYTEQTKQKLQEIDAKLAKLIAKKERVINKDKLKREKEQKKTEYEATKQIYKNCKTLGLTRGQCNTAILLCDAAERDMTNEDKLNKCLSSLHGEL